MGQHVQHSGNGAAASRPLVTQADRFGWQRAALRELAAMLEAHPGLPAITWTIGPGGALAGRINGLTASAAEVRATFFAWRDALGLIEPAGQPVVGDSAVTHLRASARRGAVSVRLTANVFSDDSTDDAGAAAPPRQRRTVRPYAGPLPRPRLRQGPEPRQIL
jgi:hypothetical protein